MLLIVSWFCHQKSDSRCSFRLFIIIRLFVVVFLFILLYYSWIFALPRIPVLCRSIQTSAHPRCRGSFRSGSLIPHSDTQPIPSVFSGHFLFPISGIDFYQHFLSLRYLMQTNSLFVISLLLTAAVGVFFCRILSLFFYFFLYVSDINGLFFADFFTEFSPQPISSPGSSTSSRDASPSRDLSPVIGQLRPSISVKRGARGFGFTLRAIRVYLGDTDYYTLHHLVVVSIVYLCPPHATEHFVRLSEVSLEKLEFVSESIKNRPCDISQPWIDWFPWLQLVSFHGCSWWVPMAAAGQFPWLQLISFPACSWSVSIDAAIILHV